MSRKYYGKNKQVWFDSQEEEDEAIEYILNSSNVNFEIHEDNQMQGAWAPEERIHFKKETGVPECLKRIMTAGHGSLYGRINCKEFCEVIRDKAKKSKEKRK